MQAETRDALFADMDVCFCGFVCFSFFLLPDVSQGVPEVAGDPCEWQSILGESANLANLADSAAVHRIGVGASGLHCRPRAAQDSAGIDCRKFL